MTSEVSVLRDRLRRELAEFINGETKITERAQAMMITEVVARFIRHVEEAEDVGFPIETDYTVARALSAGLKVDREAPLSAIAVITGNDSSCTLTPGTSRIDFEIFPVGEWRWPGGSAPLPKEHAIAICRNLGLLL